MTQREAVIQTMENLGGIATLGQLYSETFKIKDCVWKTKTPAASIRQIVQLDKNIYKIKPGLYALKSHQKDLEESGILVQTEKNKDSKEIQQFNHSYYQGLLISIGNMRKMKTFVPSQDKNKLYANQKLGEIATLQTIPQFSFDHFIQRISTVDVIWFNQNLMPDSLFEIEHSTDIQNSLLKFNDFLDFSTRMVIVADEHRYEEYKKKLGYSSFDRLKQKNRVLFFKYSELEKQYKQELEKQEMEFIL